MSSKEPSENTALLVPNSVDSTENDISLEQRFHEHNLSLPKAPILISLWLGSFLVAIDGTIVANITNTIAAEFQESDKKQWIATSFLLTNTAFQCLYGKLSDISGRKPALLAAQFFFGLGCLLTCFARNVTEFSLARAVCGIGGGGISAMSSITVSDICTAKDRGMYQGYANIVYGTGQLLGAPIGGFLITRLGWKMIFAVQVPMIFICFCLAHRNVNIELAHLKPANERYTLKNLSRLDIIGSGTLVMSISGLLFLFSSNLNKLVVSVITVLSFGLFVYNEKYWASERIIPFELLRGNFGLTSLVTVLSTFVMFGDMFRSPIYLQVVQDISLAKSGIFILFGSAACAGASLITGSIMRHTKLELVRCSFLLVLAAVFLQLTGAVTTALLTKNLEPNQTHYESEGYFSMLLKSKGFAWKFIYITSSVFSAFGYGCVLVSVLVSIVFTVPKSQQATLTGVFYLWRSIGSVLGASVTLTTYDLSLNSKLWNYMKSQGLSETYPKLIRDSGYLRTHFSGEKLAALLEIYRDCFVWSFGPAIVSGILSLALAFFLVRGFQPSRN
ncbi:LANO_0D06458g1_1 [Lachancea nothofagi CBS 11611]|uniref:LANO_0D06458g1_1 n=1 Tax=Lachancea nothofagi CBS 11611 TaxID=1266666 RepID=A0A1G4JHC1_9SACH|nr:LANO_0D06458g1_1 [Lachancea nothofagi CBS 11611]